jgi:hypothetical protein
MLAKMQQDVREQSWIPTILTRTNHRRGQTAIRATRTKIACTSLKAIADEEMHVLIDTIMSRTIVYDSDHHHTL